MSASRVLGASTAAGALAGSGIPVGSLALVAQDLPGGHADVVGAGVRSPRRGF
ncbi:hypothetical protein [Streptomyces canus]|uniref:hypothetical protein n=1 Tax=Streptomyces canus TaxID=58343 RepID=UPI002E2B3B81|nr:hypothetical protein [Streptomyces canus]